MLLLYGRPTQHTCLDDVHRKPDEQFPDPVTELEFPVELRGWKGVGGGEGGIRDRCFQFLIFGQVPIRGVRRIKTWRRRRQLSDKATPSPPLLLPPKAKRQTKIATWPNKESSAQTYSPTREAPGLHPVSSKQANKHARTHPKTV